MKLNINQRYSEMMKDAKQGFGALLKTMILNAKALEESMRIEVTQFREQLPKVPLKKDIADKKEPAKSNVLALLNNYNEAEETVRMLQYSPDDASKSNDGSSEYPLVKYDAKENAVMNKFI